jgi:hypothetical protein
MCRLLPADPPSIVRVLIRFCSHHRKQIKINSHNYGNDEAKSLTKSEKLGIIIGFA